jgi:hypothetical protein
MPFGRDFLAGMADDSLQFIRDAFPVELLTTG